MKLEEAIILATVYASDVDGWPLWRFGQALRDVMQPGKLMTRYEMRDWAMPHLEALEAKGLVVKRNRRWRKP